MRRVLAVAIDLALGMLPLMVTVPFVLLLPSGPEDDILVQTAWSVSVLATWASLLVYRSIVCAHRGQSAGKEWMGLVVRVDGERPTLLCALRRDGLGVVLPLALAWFWWPVLVIIVVANAIALATTRRTCADLVGGTRVVARDGEKEAATP